jgi:hypothetical protein
VTTPSITRSTLVALFLLLLPASPGSAGTPSASWLGVGPYGGALFLDPHLSDYRWDVSPQAVWGIQGMVRRDRFGIGVRAWRSGTTQSTGILGASETPEVSLTGFELVAEPRLASCWGTHLFALASGGLLHIGYSPDRLVIDDLGGGAPLEVELEPIDEWQAGLGLALRRALPGRATLGVAVERSMLRLDTAHRAGDEVVYDRETFGNWTVRLELSQWFNSI